MRILITGVHGFVGGNLVKALKRIMKFMGWTLLRQKKWE